MNKFKILRLLLKMAAFLLCQLNLTYAGGYEPAGVGSRAVSMGGAFTGLADDWSAIFWNPAGLSYIKGNQAGISLYQPNFTVFDEDGAKNFGLNNFSIDQGDVFLKIFRSEPDQFTEKEASSSVANPWLGASFELENGIALGLGIYVPVGNFVTFDDTVFDSTGAKIDADFFNLLGVVVNNLSVSKKFGEMFSVGGGVNLLYGLTNFEADKDYTGSSRNPDYNFDLEMESAGWGLEGMIGLMFKPHKRLSIGAVWRSSSRVNLEGEAEFSHSIAGTTEESNYDQDFFVPATYSLGIAFWVKPQWVITLDWELTDWTNQRIKFDFDTEGLALTDKDVDMDWEKSNRYRIGTEYNLTDKWALRGGYFWDEAAAPDKSVSITSIVDVGKHNISLGVGRKGERWDYDLGYQLIFGERSVDGVDYSAIVHSALIGVLYKW